MNTQQYCKYCGALVDADALYCSSCGKNITPQSLQGTIVGTKVKKSEVSVPSPVGADITLSQKLNSPGAVASILLGIVALFFTLLAFYFAAD
jgi:RNA polymerase subunit RPABC4/transcription elongation factor Spt4